MSGSGERRSASESTSAGDADEPRTLESPLSIGDLRVGDLLPSRRHTPSNVSLFMYNAAVWNHHRIHYDEAYTTQVEGHPGIVIDGPLQGDWITQVVLNWIGPQDELVRFAYTNRVAAHLGETLTSGGRVAGVDVAASLVELELYVENEQGDVTTPGSATVFLAG